MAYKIFLIDRSAGSARIFGIMLSVEHIDIDDPGIRDLCDGVDYMLEITLKHYPAYSKEELMTLLIRRLLDHPPKSLSPKTI